MRKVLRYLQLILLLHSFSNSDDVCYKDDNHCTEEPNRYLFYDVNYPEGFNLRRDVYMRFAILAHKMQHSYDTRLNKFHLVLPPWSRLVHWRYSEIPEQKPWSLYFDLKSLQMFAPVIEMHEFFNRFPKKFSKVMLDVYSLQHFDDMFKTGNFEDKMKIEKCHNEHRPTFFFYNNITAANFQCLSYHGPATKLTELFLNTSAQYILINHAEVALHEYFGGKLYWQARRSMRFNKELKNIAANFRKIYLNSTDVTDITVLPEFWKNEKPKKNAVGGPYVAVHLRRKDFVRSRFNEAPSLQSVSQQIAKTLEKHQLNAVYIASDAPMEEFNQLSTNLSKYAIFKYNPTNTVIEKFGEGGIAIIDQIICSYAKYFIGTHESTFTFRIQEEREILGFPSHTTFNVLCKDENNCKEPSTWNIVY